jgi:hypothetical protein
VRSRLVAVADRSSAIKHLFAFAGVTDHAFYLRPKCASAYACLVERESLNVTNHFEQAASGGCPRNISDHFKLHKPVAFSNSAMILLAHQ